MGPWERVDWLSLRHVAEMLMRWPWAKVEEKSGVSMVALSQLAGASWGRVDAGCLQSCAFCRYSDARHWHRHAQSRQSGVFSSCAGCTGLWVENPARSHSGAKNADAAWSWHAQSGLGGQHVRLTGVVPVRRSCAAPLRSCFRARASDRHTTRCALPRSGRLRSRLPSPYL